MIFGQPMEFSRYYGKESDRAALRAVTDEIMAEIAKLSGQEYLPELYAAQAKELIAAANADKEDKPGIQPLPEKEYHRQRCPSIHCKARDGTARLGPCEWEC